MDFPDIAARRDDGLRPCGRINHVDDTRLAAAIR
jgi:hypothetical protein